MEKYFERLRTYITENPPDFGDGESVLTLLYEAYAESNRMDDGTIKKHKGNGKYKNNVYVLLPQDNPDIYRDLSEPEELPLFI